jgi:hypothetical protein
LEAPPGAGCMGGGVPPCGLSAGAPPEPVSSGPVHPWGCNWPLLSGNTVRPVLWGESPGLLSSFFVWAVTLVAQMTRQSVERDTHTVNLRMGSLFMNIPLKNGCRTLPSAGFAISDLSRQRWFDPDGYGEFFLQRQASNKAATSELFRPVAGCDGAASRRSRPLESCDFENGRAL